MFVIIRNGIKDDTYLDNWKKRDGTATKFSFKYLH